MPRPYRLAYAVIEEKAGPVQAIYYRDPSGDEPVRIYIMHLQRERQIAIDTTIALLNRLASGDQPLPFPYSSQVDGPLRELRCHYGRDLYRILYRRSENLFVLLHIVAKRSARLPEADIAIARARWEDFKQRMDAIARRPPRAAGHDAP